MSFVIKPSSDKAKRIRVYPNTNKPELPQTHLQKKFPFAKLQVGESFFMQVRECEPYLILLAKETATRYNRLYNIYFATVVHNDEPKRLEVARIY